MYTNGLLFYFGRLYKYVDKSKKIGTATEMIEY